MVSRVLVLALLVILVPGLAQAAHFDLIYADQITIRAPLAHWGIMLAGSDFGLLVNKGATALDADELNAADFDVEGVPEWPDTTSTCINPSLRPGFNPGYLYHSSFSPIQPDEALGSVGTLNGVLVSLVGADETFRNSWPAQFIYFQIEGSGNAPGVVAFDVNLRIGDESVAFTIFVTLIDAPGYPEDFIEFNHAARVSSAPMVTPTQATTWGALKSLYR